MLNAKPLIAQLSKLYSGGCYLWSIPSNFPHQAPHGFDQEIGRGSIIRVRSKESDSGGAEGRGSTPSPLTQYFASNEVLLKRNGPRIQIFYLRAADCLQPFHPESAEAKDHPYPVNPVLVVLAFSLPASQPRAFSYQLLAHNRNAPPPISYKL